MVDQKRIDEFDATSEVTNTDLCLVGNPSTGKLRKIVFSNLTQSVVSSGTSDIRDLLTILDLRKHGATCDGATDDTSAIQDVLDDANENYTASSVSGSSIVAKRAVVLAPLGRDIKISNITIPARVDVVLNGSRLRAIDGTDGDLITMNGQTGLYNGFVVGTGTDTDLRGIVTGGDRVAIDQVNAGLLYGSALVLNNNNHKVSRCYMQGNLGADDYTDYTGVCHVNGSDHQVWNSLFNSVRDSSAGASDSEKAVGVCIVDGANLSFQGVVAELNDVGWYCDSNDNGIHIINCRGELSRLHGYWFNDGEGTLLGCDAWNNGLEANATYDAYRFETGTRFTVDANTARQTGTPNLPANAFADYSTGTTGRFRNTFGPTNKADFVSGVKAIHVANADGGRVIPTQGSFDNIAAAATTYNIQGGGRAWVGSRFALKSTGAVNFTAFTGGVPGLEITVLGDGNTTFVNSASLATLTGSNTLAAANKVTKWLTVDGTNWVQIA